MTFDPPPLIPELDVIDLDRSLAIYVDVFGFSIHLQRPEERFAYLIREKAHLMLEEAAGPGRRFRTAPLDYPLGRGINLQIAVSNVDELYDAVQRSGLVVHIPLEVRWYRHEQREVGNRQFVVIDTDGYLLRFVGLLGWRKAPSQPPSP
jgi:catechol 2,3-dioxygenase-like lactoylglutathione lyase family enzyme